MLGFSKESQSRQFIQLTQLTRDRCSMHLLKTANLNSELVYAIWLLNTFYLRADVRLLKNETF